MIPVHQTVFAVPGGNCFSACIASILELPLEDVPYFMGDSVDHDWWSEFNAWLEPRGLFAMCFKVDAAGGEGSRPLCWHVLTGDSPRGPWKHSVVARGCAIEHDPHPSHAGINTQEDVVLLVPFDPAALSRH